MSAIYFKTMRREFYEPGKIIHTSKINYGFEAGRFSAGYAAMLDTIIEISKETACGFEALIVFAIKASSAQLPPGLDGDLRSSGRYVDLTEHLYGKRGPRIHTSQLRQLYHQAIRCDFNVPMPTIAVRLWEHLYERVRADHRCERPRRLDSFFTCRDELSVIKYQRRHGLGQIICQVDAEHCDLIFASDMTVLDRVSEESCYETALPQIINYWDQKHSDDPIIEVMLQGKVRLLDEI